MTSIHDLHALRLMPPPFSSVPQSAQLIDCIVVNVVCHVSVECGTPPPPLLRVEARSEFFVAKGVSDREGEKEVQRETEPEQPSCEKETKRREERG